MDQSKCAAKVPGLARSTPLGARGDVAQELGQLAEGGSNLDQRMA
jgi:hypothetical protein